MVDFQGSTKIEPKKEKPNIIDELGNSLKSRHLSCALNLDEERLRDILDNIPSAVIVVEKPDIKVTYANKRAAELVGVNPCGYELNKNPLSFKILTLEEKICPAEELYAYRALFNEESFRNSTAIVEQPNGKRFTVVVSAKPLYDKDGRVNAAIVIFEDVTAHVNTQNSLLESEERLKMARRLRTWEAGSTVLKMIQQFGQRNSSIFLV